MKIHRNKHGFTMAEMLIVVAIIAVLSGVAFIGVVNYQRSMAQIERDGIAKEIFVAAQNHLTMAESQGYLGLEKTSLGGENGSKAGVYYLEISGGGVDADYTDIYDLMLPFASIDETVRGNGNFVIIYQAEPAIVLDVFYATASGRFNTSLSYDAVKDLGGDAKKGDRRVYGDSRAVVGWYGGEEAQSLEKGAKLNAPEVTVENAERLKVTVTDTNSLDTNAYLTLILEGETSGAKQAVKLRPPGMLPESNVKSEATGVYEVILDDITDGTNNHHFAALFDDFIPGENVRLTAVAFSNKVLTNIEYSGEKITNSLFETVSASTPGGVTDTAHINNIRHLENLDNAVSNVQSTDSRSVDDKDKLDITKAVQTTDLSWSDFKTKIDSDNTKIYYDGDKSTADGTYYPVSPTYALTYDGQNHTIRDVSVNCTGPGGLFGTLKSESSVSNLMLVDFSINAAGNAGALAGTLSGISTVTNVVARDKTDTKVYAVQSTGAAAGGLIGDSGSSTIQYSAAALLVKSTGAAAGGLIGTASGGSVVGCYAGGHTTNGSYNEYVDGSGKIIYNVTSANDEGVLAGEAGGLIGSAGAAAITKSYSTCSVSGGTAGGLIGTGSGSAKLCYSTGLVSGTTKGAFAGTYDGSIGTDTEDFCYYYSIINELPDADAGFTYLAPISGTGAVNNLKALDESAESYNSFVGSDWKPAGAYDNALIRYYQGNYNLQTVYQLANDSAAHPDMFVSVHYGDWPAPELFALNAAAP